MMVGGSGMHETIGVLILGRAVMLWETLHLLVTALCYLFRHVVYRVEIGGENIRLDV